MATARKPIIVLLGPPGSGKSTLGAAIAAEAGVPEIKLADLIRAKIAAGGEDGAHLTGVVSEGRTISDVLVLQMLKEKIESPECAGGYLLSDFPETLAQAQTFDYYLVKNDLKEHFKILELYTPDDICKKRLAGRWIHEASGRSYGTGNIARPKSLGEGEEASADNMKDDETGDTLVRMEKDTIYEIPKNLFVYHLGCEPTLDHFGRVYCTRIDSSGEDLDAIVKDCAGYMNRTIFYEAPIAEALADAPLPEESNCIDAETRVYARGDFLERRKWAPPATRSGENFGGLAA